MSTSSDNRRGLHPGTIPHTETLLRGSEWETALLLHRSRLCSGIQHPPSRALPGQRAPGPCLTPHPLPSASPPPSLGPRPGPVSARQPSAFTRRRAVAALGRCKAGPCDGETTSPAAAKVPRLPPARSGDGAPLPAHTCRPPSTAAPQPAMGRTLPRRLRTLRPTR